MFHFRASGKYLRNFYFVYLHDVMGLDPVRIITSTALDTFEVP